MRTKRSNAQGTDNTNSAFLSKNLALIYNTLIARVGHAGCAVFCKAVGVPAINKRPYYSHGHFLFNNMELLLKSSFELILKVLQAQHVYEHLPSGSDVDVVLARVAAAPRADVSADGANDDGVETLLAVVVSFDGTRMTRWHESYICVWFVIRVDTGFVLDHEVVSNYCGTCANKRPLCQQRPFLLGKLPTLTASKNILEVLIQWIVKLHHICGADPFNVVTDTLLLLAMETVIPTSPLINFIF